MRAPERVTVDLPLSISAVAAIMQGLCAVWPECEVSGHPNELIIELSGPKVEDES
jgi:hypothetical protein